MGFSFDSRSEPRKVSRSVRTNYGEPFFRPNGITNPSQSLYTGAVLTYDAVFTAAFSTNTSIPPSATGSVSLSVPSGYWVDMVIGSIPSNLTVYSVTANGTTLSPNLLRAFGSTFIPTLRSYDLAGYGMSFYMALTNTTPNYTTSVFLATAVPNIIQSTGGEALWPLRYRGAQVVHDTQ